MAQTILSRIKISHFYTVLFLFGLMWTIQACQNEPSKKNPYIHEQGVFEFLGESVTVDDKKKLPDNVDPEKVLCFGKGLKVGRCISKQIETGICVGLIKNHKHVIAIEIPCETITQDSITVEEELLSE